MYGNMKKPEIKKTISLVIAVLFVLTAGLAAAGLMTGEKNRETMGEAAEEKYESGFVISEPGSFDSEDTAVVKEIDSAAGSITLMNIETGRYYTLSYDGTSMIRDKYGNAMAMSQAAGGDIVDVTFMKSKKTLTSMQISDSAWVLENVEKYSFNALSRGAEVGSGVYSLENNPVVVSEGREAALEDIVKGDVVSIRGVGNSVYSVVVESGHGYLRLSDDEYLKGGWIEVGQSVIQEITRDMLLVVPEGTYDVHITAPGIDVTKPVTVYRNQEVTLDVSDVRPEEPKAGRIIFTVKPSSAVISIDGKEADISVPVELEYGLHQMVAEAEGYETVTRFIRVGEEMANINITMDEAVEPTPSRKEENTVSVSANELSGYYKVYIDSPSDVEVYLDNIYVGVSPVSFKKEAGTHTITLRKTGYVTKSYTVQVDDTEKDVTYSFTDLVKENSTTGTGSSSTGSGSSSGSSSSTGRGNSSGSSSSTGRGNSSGSSSSTGSGSSSGSSSSGNGSSSGSSSSGNGSSSGSSSSSGSVSGNSSSSGSSSSGSGSSTGGSSSGSSSSTGGSSSGSGSSTGGSSSGSSSSTGGSSSGSGSSGGSNSNSSSSDSNNGVPGNGIVNNEGEVEGGGIVNDGR
ncbi:MAG: PEGA domain-containing protein [Kineothrix sp.]